MHAGLELTSSVVSHWCMYVDACQSMSIVIVRSLERNALLISWNIKQTRSHPNPIPNLGVYQCRFLVTDFSIVVLNEEPDPQVLFGGIQTSRDGRPAAIDEDFQDGGVAESVNCEGF